MKSISSIIGIALVLAVGCSRRKSEQVPAPSSEATASATNAAAPAHATANGPVTSISPLPTNLPTLPSPSTAENTMQVESLENSYKSNLDFSTRVDVIYKLSDIGTAEAISVLGRLFHLEHDTDLRVEILDSLFDFEGSDDKKAAIFAAGAAAGQPKEVREAAIDGLGDIEPHLAIPILQALLSDPDEEIRDDAKDAIEQLQSQMAQPK
jgi:HEAT repeat protein